LNPPKEVTDYIFRSLTKGTTFIDNKKIIVVQGDTTTTYNSCYYEVTIDINGDEIVVPRGLNERNECLHTNRVSIYC
jgi:hypothetical protein